MLFNLDDRPIVEEPFTIPVFSQVSHRAALHHILHCAPVAPRQHCDPTAESRTATLPPHCSACRAIDSEQSEPSLVHA